MCCTVYFDRKNHRGLHFGLGGACALQFFIYNDFGYDVCLFLIKIIDFQSF